MKKIQLISIQNLKKLMLFSIWKKTSSNLINSNELISYRFLTSLCVFMFIENSHVWFNDITDQLTAVAWQFVSLFVLVPNFNARPVNQECIVQYVKLIVKPTHYFTLKSILEIWKYQKIHKIICNDLEKSWKIEIHLCHFLISSIPC